MPRRADGRTSEAGFTLVETLVALAVASVVIAAAASAFSFVTMQPRRADQGLRLALAQDRLMFDLRANPALSAGETSGRIDDVQWRALVSDRLDRGSRDSRFPPSLVRLHIAAGAFTLESEAFILAAGLAR